jgi:hypothetical protein
MCWRCWLRVSPETREACDAADYARHLGMATLTELRRVLRRAVREARAARS